MAETATDTGFNASAALLLRHAGAPVVATSTKPASRRTPAFHRVRHGGGTAV